MYKTEAWSLKSIQKIKKRPTKSLRLAICTIRGTDILTENDRPNILQFLTEI